RLGVMDDYSASLRNRPCRNGFGSAWTNLGLVAIGFLGEWPMVSEQLARVLRSPPTRLMGIALGLTALILAALILPPWISVAIPYREVRRASRMLLLAAQPAYGATLALLVTGLGVLGRTVVRARSRGESRPWAARWLLLCVSGVLAI